MNQNTSVWTVVLVGFAAANLPFASDRLLAVLAVRMPKSLALRLIELLVFYLLVGYISLSLEKLAGQITPQGWEFYVITGTLFITFAFPSFIYRYLFKRQK